MVSCTCRDPNFWPFDLISMSQAQVHTWFHFCETGSNIYEVTAFTRFFASLPAVTLLAVTLTFDILIQNSNQHIYESKYSYHKNWVKFPSLVFRYCVHPFFRVIVCCDLDLWPFDQNWAKFEISFISFWDTIFTRFSGCTDTLAHSETDRPKHVAGFGWVPFRELGG